MMQCKKKRSFLLLEVMLALQLVAFGSLYVIQNPLRYFREEIHSLQAMEYQRVADLTFCEIKESLYRNQIAWNHIANKKKEASLALWKEPLDTSSPEILGKVWRFYRIYGKERRGKDKHLYRLLTIELLLSNHPTIPKEEKIFSYQVLAQKKSLIF